MVENAFTRNEIMRDMQTAWNVYDGSRSLTDLQGSSGASRQRATTTPPSYRSSQLTELNKMAEQHIRTRIRSVLYHAKMLRNLGVGQSNPQIGRTGRPHAMAQRPIVVQQSKRDPRLSDLALGSAVSF